MRGEVVILFASVFSLTAVLLLVFTHVGQNNTSRVSRAVSMIDINVEGFGLAVEQATGLSLPDLYNTTPQSPLSSNLGLRPLYKWGLYSYCGYTSPSFNNTNYPSLSQGACTPTTFASQFNPYDAMARDIPDRYLDSIQSFLPQGLLRDATYTGILSKAAYYFTLLGTISAGIAFIAGSIRATFTFLLAYLFSMLGSLCLLIAASMWTALVNRVKYINSHTITRTSDGTQILSGIQAKRGVGVLLLWSAFAVLTFSILPYGIIYASFRGFGNYCCSLPSFRFFRRPKPSRPRSPYRRQTWAPTIRSSDSSGSLPPVEYVARRWRPSRPPPQQDHQVQSTETSNGAAKV